MIFIFSAESALRRAGGGDEGRRLAKDEGCRGGGEGGAEYGRGWLPLVAVVVAVMVVGGWQSVEGSGADQWHDGGNPGILTL